jgi:hypothetical protein
MPKCIHKLPQQMTVSDAPVHQHAVSKSVLKDSSWTAHMVDQLSFVYGDFCTGVPRLWHWVNQFKMATLTSLMYITDVCQECEAWNEASTSNNDPRNYITVHTMECRR